MCGRSLLFLFCIITLLTSAQKFQQKYHGYNVSSSTKCAVKHRNGTFTVSATRNDTTYQNNQLRIYSRLALLKLNETGSVTSAKIFSNDTFHVHEARIDTLDDQSYIVTCRAAYLAKAWGSYQTWASFILLYKISVNGDVIWCKSISDCSDTSSCVPDFNSNAVSSIGDGTFYLNFSSWHEQQGKLHTIRFDGNGNIMWHRVLVTSNWPEQMKCGINKTVWIITNSIDGINFLCYDVNGILLHNFICGGPVNDFIQLADSSLLVATEGSMFRIDKNFKPLWVVNNYSKYGSLKLIDETTFETSAGDSHPIRTIYDLATGKQKKNFIYAWQPYSSVRSVKLETCNDGGRILFYNSNNGLHVIKTDTNGKTGCEVLIEDAPDKPIYQGNLYMKANQTQPVSQEIIIAPFMFSSATVTASPQDACCDAQLTLYGGGYGGICKGSQMTYLTTGMTSYVWSNGASGPQGNYTIWTDTTISVIGFNSCKSDTQTIQVKPFDLPVLGLTLIDDTICLGNEAILLPSGNYDHLWLQVKHTFNAQRDTILVKPDTTGVFYISATIGYNKYTTCHVKDSFFIQVNNPPDIPVLSRSGDTLFSSASSGNQWFLNGSPIAGATEKFLVLSQQGSYHTEVSNDAGCSTSSAVCNCILIGVDELNNVVSTIFPNPANDYIEISAKRILSSVRIYDASGRIYVSAQELETENYRADLRTFCSGLYFIEAVSEGDMSVLKFIKQ